MAPDTTARTPVDIPPPPAEPVEPVEPAQRNQADLPSSRTGADARPEPDGPRTPELHLQPTPEVQQGLDEFRGRKDAAAAGGAPPDADLPSSRTQETRRPSGDGPAPADPPATPDPGAAPPRTERGPAPPGGRPPDTPPAEPVRGDGVPTGRDTTGGSADPGGGGVDTARAPVPPTDRGVPQGAPERDRPPEAPADTTTTPADRAGQPQEFYRWVSMPQEDAARIEAEGGDLDAAFEQKALEGNWYSPDPSGPGQYGLDHAVASEWGGSTTSGYLARCYRVEPTPGTESYEGTAQHVGGDRQVHAAGAHPGDHRVHADLVGGGRQAYIPDDGGRAEWRVERVDDAGAPEPPGGGQDAAARVPAAVYDRVTTDNPLAAYGPQALHGHDPLFVVNHFSGPITRYVQP